MDGHGDLIQRFPLTLFPLTSFPFSSTSRGSTPGNGNVAKVGLAGVMPARFEIRIPPVSVCHHVSTMGQRFFPICSSYQCHASSLIGSPTVPKTFKLDKSFPFNGSNPNPINERIAVGAV